MEREREVKVVSVTRSCVRMQWRAWQRVLSDVATDAESYTPWMVDDCEYVSEQVRQPE